jgi:hypothetical protein
MENGLFSALFGPKSGVLIKNKPVSAKNGVSAHSGSGADLVRGLD